MTNSSMIQVAIQGIGAIGPGFNNWLELKGQLLASNLNLIAKTQLPYPELLPPAERRRASDIVKAGLCAGLEACQDAEISAQELQTVFTSSGGDGTNCKAICEQLASDDPLISPTKFHNSVHNTVAGYWGIATGCMEPSQVISAEDGSFAAGLLEAAIQTIATHSRTLLISYDTSYPEPLNSIRHIADTAAIALILDVPNGHKGRYPRLRLSLSPSKGAAECSTFSVPIPTLASLPLLDGVAHFGTRTIAIPYQANKPLHVEVCP